MTSPLSLPREALRYLDEEENWCADVVCDGDDVEVSVAGTPKAPSAGCLACAQRVVADLSALRARARTAVLEHAAKEDLIPEPSAAGWELIAVQCLDEDEPDAYSLIWNEPARDLYGWWEVVFQGDELVAVRREEW